jgi:hypothetical protein
MPEKILYQGKAFYPQKSIYAIFIFPLVTDQEDFSSPV